MSKPSGARKKERFVGIPRKVMDSDAYVSLSFSARELISCLIFQHNGFNNGDFEATWGYMKSRGWRSNDTKQNALDEALGKGFIFITRQGFKGRCSLYAVTWQPLATQPKYASKFDELLICDFRLGTWRERWKTWNRQGSRRVKKNPTRVSSND